MSDHDHLFKLIQKNTDVTLDISSLVSSIGEQVKYLHEQEKSRQDKINSLEEDIKSLKAWRNWLAGVGASFVFYFSFMEDQIKDFFNR